MRTPPRGTVRAGAARGAGRVRWGDPLRRHGSPGHKVAVGPVRQRPKRPSSRSKLVCRALRRLQRQANSSRCVCRCGRRKPWKVPVPQRLSSKNRRCAQGISTWLPSCPHARSVVVLAGQRPVGGQTVRQQPRAGHHRPADKAADAVRAVVRQHRQAGAAGPVVTEVCRWQPAHSQRPRSAAKRQPFRPSQRGYAKPFVLPRGPEGGQPREAPRWRTTPGSTLCCTGCGATAPSSAGARRSPRRNRPTVPTQRSTSRRGDVAGRGSNRSGASDRRARLLDWPTPPAWP